MPAYDLYDLKGESLEQSKFRLEELLNIKFEQRQNTYHRGVYYTSGSLGQEVLEIKRNLDPLEDVPLESDFSSSEFLLYVHNTKRSTVLFDLICQSAEYGERLRSESF